MVLIKFLIIIFVFFYAGIKSAYSSQILDYETETFISDLILEIKKINNIQKKINFKIISDKEINAFVDQNDLIYITSGLIEYSPNFVALLSVIAHEIGHIESNHIKKRQKSIKNYKTLSNLTNLSIIAGSLVSKSPALIQGSVLNSATVSNALINFSKEQEREADFYSIQTLKKLNLYSSSIVNLLKIIEKKALEKGFDKEKQRISSHPYFNERIEIIKFSKENKEENYDFYKNKKFNFIKAKFIAYNDNIELINKLEYPFSKYANAIQDSKKGKLSNSLKKLNNLISNYPDNIYLLETKADILFSYGYTNEAVNFYKVVLNKYPDNLYARIRIFENIDLENISENERINMFKDNLNLLIKFINNQNILNTYLKLAKYNKKKEWIDFLNFWINKNNDDINIINKEIDKFSNSSDKDLLVLVRSIKNKFL